VALMAQELSSGEYEDCAKCKQLLPHVEPLFASKPAAEEAVKARAQVLANAVWYLQLQRNYRVAAQLNQQALDCRENELGEQHPNTLTSVSNLAGITTWAAPR
jgi:hypothetical protein